MSQSSTRTPVRTSKPSASARFDSALGWSPRFGTNMALRIVLCVLVFCVFALPFLAVISGAFDRNSSPTEISLLPKTFTLQNFEAAAQQGLWGYLLNSLVVAGGGLLLQMTVSVFAAYSLSRKKFRGQALVMLLVLMTMMLPEEVIGIPLSLVLGDLPLLGISLRGTVLAVILPVGVWGFSIFIMSEFMKEIPGEIEEAARLDGVGEFRMLFTIILPLCKPALGVIGIFGFMMVWDQYLLPLIAANDPSDYTLTVALSVLRNDTTVGPGVLLAGAVMAMIPSLLVYLFLQRSMIRGITSGATKG
jgi:multiple sugar transport system permease protein